jgi:hypothetical protein
LEQSRPPVDPYAPIDYPSAYPPQSQPYPSAFPPPYQPYGANPYDPYRVGPPQGTNGQAIGALVAGILGVPLCFCFIPSIVAIVLGIVAMNETKRTGQEGHGMALAGVILGAISIALGVVIMIIGAVAPDNSEY